MSDIPDALMHDLEDRGPCSELTLRLRESEERADRFRAALVWIAAHSRGSIYSPAEVARNALSAPEDSEGA